jgi:glc operon protein GlcG
VVYSKPSLSLIDAKAIAEAAEAYAESRGFPVSIAVVDESTYLLHLVRLDGAPYLSAEGAVEKARTAAEGGHPTTFFEQPLNAGRFSMLKMPHIYPVEGGIPVMVDGRCAGAIGVAGVLPELDAAIAAAGLAALDHAPAPDLSGVSTTSGPAAGRWSEQEC